MQLSLELRVTSFEDGRWNYAFQPILIRISHKSILTIIIWLNTSGYIFAFRVMLVICLKSNSPVYRYLAKYHVRTIHDSLSERFGLRPITTWRYFFLLLSLLLLPYGMRCAIVTSAQHFQWISDHIANPRLDTWHLACTVRYLLSRFILVTCFLVRNLTYYEPNISLVTQYAVELCPVIINYTAYRDEAYQVTRRSKFFFSSRIETLLNLFSIMTVMWRYIPINVKKL